MWTAIFCEPYTCSTTKKKIYKVLLVCVRVFVIGQSIYIMRYHYTNFNVLYYRKKLVYSFFMHKLWTIHGTGCCCRLLCAYTLQSSGGFFFFASYSSLYSPYALDFCVQFFVCVSAVLSAANRRKETVPYLHNKIKSINFMLILYAILCILFNLFFPSYVENINIHIGMKSKLRGRILFFFSFALLFFSIIKRPQ